MKGKNAKPNENVCQAKGVEIELSAQCVRNRIHRECNLFVLRQKVLVIENPTRVVRYEPEITRPTLKPFESARSFVERPMCRLTSRMERNDATVEVAAIGPIILKRIAPSERGRDVVGREGRVVGVVNFHMDGYGVVHAQAPRRREVEACVEENGLVLPSVHRVSLIAERVPCRNLEGRERRELVVGDRDDHESIHKEQTCNDENDTRDHPLSVHALTSAPDRPPLAVIPATDFTQEDDFGPTTVNYPEPEVEDTAIVL